MKKITFLMLHLNYGGIEKQVTTLANELSKDENYDVHIISIYDMLNSNSFYNLDNKVKVKYILPYGPDKKKILNSLKSFKLITFLKEILKTIKILYTKNIKLKKIIEKIDTDILVSSRIEFSKKINRKDIITISQEHSFENTKKYIKKVKTSFKYIDYLVVMTNKACELYEMWLLNENLKPKVIVIANMIENENIVREENTHKQIISIGRLEKVKRFDILLTVFEKIHNDYPEFKLKIVGDGSQRKILENKIKVLNLMECVILTGTLDKEEIQNQLEIADIFISTSKSESFSLVLVEAMNAGVVCVAFDIDVGPREIITDTKDGYLIKDDNVLQMIDKVEYLISNEESLENMSKNAKITAEKFYDIELVKLWKNLFERKVE